MSIDIHYKALQLLNILANSLLDRQNIEQKTFFFSTIEIDATKDWLLKFVEELEKGNAR